MKNWANKVWEGHKVVYVLIAVVGVIGSLGLLAIESNIAEARQNIAKAVDQSNKNNCVGVYSTIPCHQYKIEQIMLEEKYKGGSNAQPKEPGRG